MDQPDANIALQQPEYSVIVDVRSLGTAPAQIQASESERSALAKRFDIVSIDALSATIAYQDDGSTIMVRGTLFADIVQQCVVSLEPFSTVIKHDFLIAFRPAEILSDLIDRSDAHETDDSDDSFEIDSDDCDTMAYIDGRIDVGEAVAQTLALVLDSFPRGPDAEDVAKAHGLVTEIPKDNPFSVLEQLKRKS